MVGASLSSRSQADLSWLSAILLPADSQADLNYQNYRQLYGKVWTQRSINTLVI